MKQKYFPLLFLLAVSLLWVTESKAQQLLDSANVLTVDNLDDNNTGAGSGTNLSGPNYIEFPSNESQAAINDGWWTNTIGFGGNHRRASRVGTGNNTGSRARYAFDVDTTDYYMIYHHMVSSANSSPRVLVKFERFGEANPVAEFYYNERNNNLIDGRGSWFPLGVVEVFASDSALTVELGIDSTGAQLLRVDAVRALRSSQGGPDIEFGNRRSDEVVIDQGTLDTLINFNFFKDRAPMDFPQTTFKFGGFSDKILPVYNLGSSPLTITDFQFQSTRYTVTTPTPIVIQPGEFAEVTVRFAPLGEEVTEDTMVIVSDDVLEPEATIPLFGEGINYNFVLNASVGATEPHWNVPTPGGTYEEIGAFLASVQSPWAYPIPGGNLRSTVSVAADVNVAGIYKFNIPDTLFGSYFLEYSGPAGSPNAATSATIDVVTPFYSNPNPALGDTQRVTGFNERAITSLVFWARIGGNQVFTLNGGGETTVRFTNPNQGTDFLRLDLLRVRLVPIAPDISTSLDPGRLLNYGSVSIHDSIRQGEFNYQRNFLIGSNGETPLVIDTMFLANEGNTPFTIDNLPEFPLTLPAIDGQYNLLVSFLPDEILNFTDQIRIVSNDPDSDTTNVSLSGQGVGVGITVDDTDPTLFVFPSEIIDWTGGLDPANMEKWHRITGLGGINGTRLLTPIYINPTTGTQRVEWFPNFPFNPLNPGVSEIDTFNVFVQIPTASPNSSPAVLYRIKHSDGVTDTVISQWERTLNEGKIPLGQYRFLRGGQDSPGSGTIFGSIELINDTALVSAYFGDGVNIARRDTHFVRADAVIIEEAGIETSVEDSRIIPEQFSLSQNYPNPFNPTTQIQFALPQKSIVELKIYDILGREVRSLLSGEQAAGVHTIMWNGKNNYGSQVSSGMYIYRISAGDFVQTKKMMMLK